MEKEQAPTLEIELEVAEEALVPHYASSGAAGADVRAHLAAPLVIEPGCTALVPTGIKVAIPCGYEMQIRPRSGLALNAHITVLNTPGTIDSDYRGEIQIILINHGNRPFIVEPGMRIAQIVVAPVLQAHFLRCSALTPTGRGGNGFGHTGVH